MAPPFLCPINKEYKLFVRADIDSLLMLFFDNMSSLIAILGVMAYVIPGLAVPFGSTSHEAHKAALADITWKMVCPGIAWSLAFGNLWYAWMAAKLAGHEKRTDVTALPYGINTPAGFVTCWNVMLPIAGAYLAVDPNMSANDWATKTWQTGCACNFIGGLFEIAGSMYACIARCGILCSRPCPCPRARPCPHGLTATRPVSQPSHALVSNSPKPHCRPSSAAHALVPVRESLNACSWDVRPYFSKAALYAPVSAVGFVWLALVPISEVAKEPIIGLAPLALAFTGFFANGGKGERCPSRLGHFAIILTRAPNSPQACTPNSPARPR